MTRPLKVLVKSPYSLYSGYGRDGFGLVRALQNWGCDVYPQPTWMDCPIPQDLLPLFGKTLETPFDLTINHWDPAHLFITREARKSTRVAVAWSMWEFSSPAPDAVKPNGKKPVNSGFVGFPKVGISSMRKRLQWFDLVLGYDQVSLDAFLPFLPNHTHRGVLQGGYDARDWKHADREWHDNRFGFIMHGALNARKQPWLAIEAFNKLKHEMGSEFEGATLSLHTSVPGDLFPELNAPLAPSKIRVFVDSFDKYTLDQFYASGHCLLAPSRGEGKNLPALEFMTTGGVVAATNYGGHTQWLGGDWAYPLDYELQATFGDKPWGPRDARVSVDHLAETIWHIYTNRGEARAKAQRAEELIPKLCDWSVVLQNLFNKVGEEVDGPGREIMEQAYACRRHQEEPGPFSSLARGMSG